MLQKTFNAFGVALLITLVWLVLPSFHLHHNEHALMKKSNVAEVPGTVSQGTGDDTLNRLNHDVFFNKRADESSSLANSSVSSTSSSLIGSVEFSSLESESSASQSSEVSETFGFSSSFSSLASSSETFSSSDVSSGWVNLSSSEISSSSSSSSSSSYSSFSSTSSYSYSSSVYPSYEEASSSSSYPETTSIDQQGVTVIIDHTTTVTMSEQSSTITQSSTEISTPTSASTTPNDTGGDDSGLSKKNKDIVIGVVVGLGVPLLAGLLFLIWWRFFKNNPKHLFINSEGELVSKNKYKKQNGSIGKGGSKFDQEDMIDEKIFDDTVNDDSVDTSNHFGYEGATFVGGRGHSRGPSQNVNINY